MERGKSGESGYGEGIEIAKKPKELQPEDDDEESDMSGVTRKEEEHGYNYG